MSEKLGDVFFAGGFTGKIKNGSHAGDDFYGLSFVVPTKQDDSHFGSSCATVFVSSDVFEDFKKHAKPCNYMKANIMYVRGGYTLISYNL